jgi:hypothetical protein
MADDAAKSAAYPPYGFVRVTPQSAIGAEGQAGDEFKRLARNALDSANHAEFAAVDDAKGGAVRGERRAVGSVVM